MSHIDHKFKDASPLDTVNKIRGILSALDIQVTEHHSQSGVKNCHSLRITIDGAGCGTNGKGVTPELSLASGYAELMERLQTGCLIQGQFDHGDLRRLGRQELEAQCGPWLTAIAEGASQLHGTTVAPAVFSDACFDMEAGADTVPVIPYYNVCDREMTCFPVRLLSSLYSTNGLCAGNSMEEAVVQGFSEIVERYNRMFFISGKAVPPTVPEDYLRQFPTAWETIQDIRSHGYDVLIKDCSMGEGYPLVAAVTIDRNTHSYHVHMGSSPVFEIALHRSLTEMFQGRSLQNVTAHDTLYTGKETGRSAADISNLNIYGSITYPLEFFHGTPTYAFVPFPDQKGKTNRDLLHMVLDYLKKKNRTLLIRDYAHLGFHTYRLLVPGMSELFYEEFLFRFPYFKLRPMVGKVFSNMASATPDELFSAQICAKNYLSAFHRPARLSTLAGIPLGMDIPEDTFLGLVHLAYLEWECGNAAAALQYAQAAARQGTQEQKNYISALEQLIALRGTGVSAQRLSFLYPDAVIEMLAEVFREKKNPFTPFLITCDPDHCDECKQSKTCMRRKQKEIFRKLNESAAAYDDAAAFRRIHDVVSAL